MKIFHRYSNSPNLTYTRGDYISELNILKAMKKFAYVDSNPTTKHDLYYVRSNAKLFKKLPHPKIYFASPYDYASFKQADAIVTFSKEWTRRLKEGVPNTAGCSMRITNPIITLQQVIDDSLFKPMQSSYMTKKLRNVFGKEDDFIIGHFGKMRPTNFPHTFLKVLPMLKKEHPNIKILFSDIAGIPSKYLKSSIKQFKFEYHKIPYALSACDLLLFPYWSAAGRYSGALRIKEAMACGVPIVTAKFEARVEELGNDYPYYTGIFGKKHSTKEAINDMFNIISKAIEDNDLRKQTGIEISNRSKFYGIIPSAKRIETDFKQVIG